MYKLATPISSLFKMIEFEKEIVKNSDFLECRDNSINYDKYSERQILFHSDLQPIHEWSNHEWNILKKIKKNKPYLKLISFHMAACCDNPILQNNIFQINGRVYSVSEMLYYSQKNIKNLKNFFGAKIEIAIENNNYYPTDAYNHITDANFIYDVVCENKIKLLFDLAHAKITSFNKNIKFMDYFKALPLKNIIQLHISKYALNHELHLAYDAHNRIDEFDVIEIKNIITNLKALEYITVEYYNDIRGLIDQIKMLKDL